MSVVFVVFQRIIEGCSGMKRIVFALLWLGLSDSVNAGETVLGTSAAAAGAVN